MPDKPVICDTKPLSLEVEAGTYWWCSCGRSATQPYCDGTHKGSAFSPVKQVVEAKSTVHWCMCKHTSKAPRCDGSHRTLGTP